MNVELKILSSEDISEFSELVDVFAGTFEMKNFTKPSGEHLAQLLQKKDFFALVAKDGVKIAGGLTVYILHQYYSEKPLAYIYDLAIHADYQRKGIGKQLITHLNKFCRENNFEEIFVQADLEDEHALDFYRQTAVSIESPVVQFAWNM